MPGMARAMGVNDPWDPEESVMGRAKYFRQMLDQSNWDVREALQNTTQARAK